MNYVCTLVLKLLVSEWIWWNLWSGCVFSFIICQKCLSCASIYGVIVLINKFLLIFFSVNGIVLICSFYWHFFLSGKCCCVNSILVSQDTSRYRSNYSLHHFTNSIKRQKQLFSSLNFEENKKYLACSEVDLLHRIG